MLLTSLVPRVQFQSVSVPTNAALLHLQETARRFFRETSVWTTTLTITTVAEQAAYELDLSGEVSVGTTPKVSRLSYLTYNGTTMHPQTYYLRTSDDYVVFTDANVPQEAVTDGVVVGLSIIPAIDGTDFPQEHVEKYVDGLVGGALYRLLKTPGRPYSDPQSAEHFYNDYKRDLIRARIDLDSEGTDRADIHRKTVNNSGNLYG